MRIKLSNLRLVPLWVAFAVLLGFGLASTTFAVTSIAQSYSTKDKISLGSIVSLKKDTSDEVVAASMKTVDNILGVVINSDSALLSLSSGEKNQVQVATSGIVQVLISDINGTIKEGDHITASPIAGVGMKATGNVRIVGVAQGALGNGSKQSYKDADGKEKTAQFGEVPVLVNVAYFFKEPEKTIIPIALQNVANSVAGKAVSPVPIFISGAIFLIMIIIVSAMIYSMIKSSIISVGRNPLSQSAIYRDLIQLSGLMILILGVGIAAIFLILTRFS